ncbi:MAG: class I SAM-dependent methyltransferase [Candidatus Riflebacteria bacterium]|nr:class I SAM-dependent methyltransferase [Candidatus Riflebacteria bacterium]
MNLLEIWDRFKKNGFARVHNIPTNDAIESFYIALLAFNSNRIDVALAFSQKALSQEPCNILYTQATSYLKKVLKNGKKNVYISPTGFAEFIRGGGNVPLYQAVAKMLRNIYQQYSNLSVLDIGVGDGLALLPALTKNIRHVDVVEPSKALLDNVRKEFSRLNISHEAFESTLQEFVKSSPKRSWDLIQSTFCLQSIPPNERGDLFKWLAETGSRLIIIEFDVPEFPEQCSPDQVKYVTERYNQGLTEYLENRELVAKEFLMPVMFGYFDQDCARTNFEHSVQEWILQLRNSGYQTIECFEVYPYWWAPAVMIDAKL